MGGIPCEQESWVSTRNLGDVRENDQTQNLDFLDDCNCNDGDLSYQETEKVWQNMKNQSNTFTKNFNKGSLRKIQRRKSQVLLEGYVEGSSNNEDDLKRTKSLTDDDLDELKGCVDLGFGFSYDEIPELCNTLPALELCYSMSQKFLDEHQKPPERSSPADSEAASSSPIANWKISSPGDHPEDVKARLKFWAQTVACTCAINGLDLHLVLLPHRSIQMKKRNVSVVRASPLEPSPNYFQTSAIAEIT
ncbi:hypothetical protein OIU84_028018 [Salix udensis]|uniref:Uncharacterized protein n=1 Tax=Salix udensis TaxID=889485 RepID=A0AAD6KC51_9ROSI|nr:hypothetical protein OIU84_028018 [Salix udensis]